MKKLLSYYEKSHLKFFSKKTIRVMKLTSFLLIMTVFQLWATETYSQLTKLSLHLENTRIADALKEIEDQSEFYFLYSPKLVDVEKRVNIVAEQETIKDILTDVFGEDVKFAVHDRQIILMPKDKSEIIDKLQQQNVVTGKVIDSETGEPIPGVNIIVKGTTVGTMTDASGNYSLSVLDRNATLVFSFIGYSSQEIPLEGRSKLNVSLVSETVGLEEVVVIGYGTQRKKDLTSSIASVSAENLNKAVVTSPVYLLTGKVPGLNITKDGNPNGAASIILRGPSTLREGAAQEPFYVVDGVPGVSLSLIPQDDIVSIDILKDASATAIYGSRASNGVILITTKRGEEGQYGISYNSYVAIETISKKFDVLTGEEYRAWLADNGLSLDPKSDDGVNTCWADEVTRLGVSHNNNLSIKGGNNRTTYIASFDYLSNMGIIKHSSNNRFILHANVEQKMFKDKLKLGFSVRNSITDVESPPPVTGSSDLYLTMWKYLPTVNIRNSDGSFREDYTYGSYNPVALIEQNIYKSRGKVFLGSANAQLNILKGLDYVINVSYQNGQSNGNSYNFKGSRLALAENGQAVRNSYESEKKLLETYASYNKVFGKHDFKLLVGYSWQEDRSGDGFQTSSTNFISDVLTYYNLGMGSNYTGFVPNYGTTAVTTLRTISGYSRINYSFNSKYFLQATVRRDGSSAFGINNRWGTFPSASVGWRITEEPFMKSLAFLNNLKIRAGYGTSGNSLGFNPLISLLRYGVSGISYYDGKYIKGVAPIQNDNPDLKWERTTMLNVGLDFGLFKGRISGTIEYYEKTTKDLIWNYPVPSEQYFVSTYTANVGQMDNKGVEFTIDLIPVQNKDFSWSTSLIMAHNKNLIVSLSNDKFKLDYLYRGAVGNHGQSGMNSQIIQPGYPIGEFYTWKYAGKDENGQSLFYKADGTLTTNPLTTDRFYAGDAQPKLTGGWHNTLSYKNFSLDFLLRGVTGNKIMNVTLCNLNYPAEATKYNQHRMVLEGGIDMGAAYTSTRYLDKGDYLRLDNITLMYSFKTNSQIVRALKIYTTLNNAFIITKYRGLDPDVYLGGLTPGVDDDNYYPKTRSFILGINVDF